METVPQEQFDDSQLPYTPSPDAAKSSTPGTEATLEDDNESVQDVVLHENNPEPGDAHDNNDDEASTGSGEQQEVCSPDACKQKQTFQASKGN